MAKLRLSACLYISVFILIFSSAAFAASITYTYDTLNRVTSVDYGNGFAEDYTYDSAGNRLSLEVSSKKVSGSGYNYPEAGFQASLSLDVRASSLGTGWLNYYYSKLRINLESTSITELSIAGDTITITGEGTVNGVAGYTFTITITDGNPDTMEIIIYNPDGTVYFTSGPGALSSGDFNVVIEYQLTTSVSPSGSGIVTPDCSAGCQYDDGTIATLSANENTGYSFSDWAGYDCNYTTVIGNTTLNGNMTISNGIITTGNFIIE